MSQVDYGYRPKALVCEHCGSALGIILRDANRVVRLNVFRSVVRGNMIESYLDYPDGGIRMFGHGIFSVRDLNDGTVYCQYCGAESKWSASRQAVDEMLARLGGKHDR